MFQAGVRQVVDHSLQWQLLSSCWNRPFYSQLSSTDHSHLILQTTVTDSTLGRTTCRVHHVFWTHHDFHTHTGHYLEKHSTHAPPYSPLGGLPVVFSRLHCSTDDFDGGWQLCLGLFIVYCLTSKQKQLSSNCTSIVAIPWLWFIGSLQTNSSDSGAF